MTIKYYFQQLCRILALIVCIFIATTALTIGVMFTYNWFVPVYWPAHISEVASLFYGIMLAITISLFFNNRRS